MMENTLNKQAKVITKNYFCREDFTRITKKLSEKKFLLYKTINIEVLKSGIPELKVEEIGEDKYKISL